MPKPDFGFAFAPNRALDLSAPLLPEVQVVLETEPSIRACMACGQCAAVCTAGAFTPLAFYRLVLELRGGDVAAVGERAQHCIDRKSTRLNSSHVRISYAVFCLKKKKLM